MRAKCLQGKRGTESRSPPRTSPAEPVTFTGLLSLAVNQLDARFLFSNPSTRTAENVPVDRRFLVSCASRRCQPTRPRWSGATDHGHAAGDFADGGFLFSVHRPAAQKAE